jgi:rod shape-determining protein MreC
VLVTCAILSLIALVLPTQAREPVANVLRRGLLAPMLLLQQRAEESRRALTNHEAIVSRRDSVAWGAMSARSLRAENVRLRDILGLGSRLGWGFIPAEALHGRGIRDEFGVTLSAGSLAGVQKLSPVVAPEGLVGVVDNVDPSISHAMVWTHPDFRVSAMSEDASAFGIVQAHLESGPGRYLMELRGVPFRTSIKTGTLIVSSGLGGVYPRGIPIGHVVAETKTAETWARTYLIRPSVFPADVYAVMILRPDRASAGVDNVWAVGTIADSSVRKIVVAGDSLARTAALAEATARQAAQDSITRDSLRKAGVPEQMIVPDTTPAVRRPVIRRDSVRPDTVHRDTVRRVPVRRDTAVIPHRP